MEEPRLSTPQQPGPSAPNPGATRKKSRRGADPSGQKRRCVSTACIACRKRKSKCDGAVPSCAACSSVYGTECVYDPNSDHRRKGVYREKVDSMKARNSTLQILIEAILNAEEEEVPEIVHKIRTCNSLDAVAEQFLKQQQTPEPQQQENEDNDDLDHSNDNYTTEPVQGERDLARKMGELRLENGAVRFIGGTSHLIYLGDPNHEEADPNPEQFVSGEDPITSWTRVTQDTQLITHLINMYFNWHYPYFTTLSKTTFFRDFMRGKAGLGRGTAYCSSLLVNAMLALGCHFTSVAGAYGTPGDNRTKGDHFFAEAKRLIVENDEYEKPRLVTVQALALMSVREAGCAREAKGWVYSGMSFRMAEDIGLNLDVGQLDKERMSDYEIDARRITFWGCYLFDKCWSNYLGRLPQIPKSSFNVSKFDVFPDEDAESWSPYTDSGFDQTFKQPSRTRAIALQMSKLSEISSDLLAFFYHPSTIGKSSGKAVELKKLSELHRRLEEWRKDLPKEFEPKDGQLPNVLLMHMFFHLQYIHLFRPFLKYSPAASPLPPHVSPRRICTANAGAISKLLRLYKKLWNLRQICNIAVYMVHSACTIHLLNLPEKTARRDITHGVKHLEEIAEDWLCARRTLTILSVLARKWNCELPEDAAFVLQRADEKYGTYSTSDVPSPQSNMAASPLSDGGLGLKTGGDYSPLTQYSRTQLARPMQQIQQQQPQRSVTDPMTTSAPLSNAGLAQQQGMSAKGSNLAFCADSMGGWGPVPVSTSMPSYQPTFGSVNRNGIPTSSPGISSSNQPTSNRPMRMDGQEWFLNDSARWHQSFEAWQMANSGQDNSVFLFGDSTNQDTPASNPESNASMQNEVNDQMAAFDGLGATLSGGGWLPGLD
ncbi:Nitrogen assimilation transcription factor nit-4 [Fusarium falciforme]|uniref:Nitrogen assimilation transcription factor nit-4 n=1 Tax=Fusarium falciforme TaxID=195108 RepID=A0A9W8V305_9HYPO|nr:Nitrogen assimilation transcription factor nit-4 [Fusarium falciforme]KAJ4193456.1 Nitrogen assimilation transcription factor nit-4 [Fusarium falciforme]KAJ4205151.1 Nitrogen assimilation transcription factor nit-4 [Fusarium falciforme]KAJ4250095.1 Nitrogen assimilation transcription factor nit-4 [Fusarium falciforme]